MSRVYHLFSNIIIPPIWRLKQYYGKCLNPMFVRPLIKIIGQVLMNTIRSNAKWINDGGNTCLRLYCSKFHHNIFSNVLYYLSWYYHYQWISSTEIFLITKCILILDKSHMGFLERTNKKLFLFCTYSILYRSLDIPPLSIFYISFLLRDHMLHSFYILTFSFWILLSKLSCFCNIKIFSIL